MLVYDTGYKLGIPIRYIKKYGGFTYFEDVNESGEYPVKDGLIKFSSDKNFDWYLPNEDEL